MLFLIVGPSGSGKDTLINYVAERMNLNKVKRFITRQPNNYEDFISVNEREFKSMSFALAWGSYGKQYGIPQLNPNEDYIINVSREVINEARNKFNAKVIELTTPREILIKRLAERGRDSPDEIAKRLNRDFKINSDFKVDTSNPDASVAGNKIINYIREIIK